MITADRLSRQCKGFLFLVPVVVFFFPRHFGDDVIYSVVNLDGSVLVGRTE